MEHLMTILELREFLNISRSKAYDLVKINGFPTIKVGKSIRIYKNDLIEWLQKQKNVI